MAEALVGGAFLSGFINVMFERLLSPEAANMVVEKKLRPELVQRLRIAIGAAKALLVDAESKQFCNRDVKDWLDSLMDAVYKADDLLDHVFTKAATHDHKEVRTFLPRFLFNPQGSDDMVKKKIEGVVGTIEDLERRKYVLGLEKVSMANWSRGTSSTYLVKGNMYGRENDQEALTNILRDDYEHQLSVITIVGMGGVGKTTLAQWLYNSEDLMKCFDLKVCVCASEKSDITEITRAIIEWITKSTCNLKDLNSIQHELKEKLSNKRFFIVLDDVWSQDRHEWSIFKTPFNFGNKGSKILVTTRSEKVASAFQTSYLYFLSELSEEYCWLVFVDNACISESNGSSKLEEIGRKIVKKCKGLPLLRQEHDVKKWKSVLLSDIWEFPVEDSKIIPALLVSYYHLPTQLKRCFVYCSLFPKDYEFDKNDLILLWMAEDLLRPSKRGQTFEEVGSECFEDLASRSFFNKYEKYHPQSYVMHDLLHDLAASLAKGFYCRLEELGETVKMNIQTRYLSFGNLSDPISKHLDKVEFLRTFLPTMPLSGFSVMNIESATCDIVLSKLKYLRVLSFCSFVGFHALPDSIGELIHLRYLDLSKTSIKILPNSLCDLYNLQTLKLRFCHYLVRLPNDMHNLLNLRYLDIFGTLIREMPGGMSKLENLQFLSYYIVGKQEDNGIKQLGELSNLHGSFEISGLENVANSDEAMGARITDKIHIDELCMCWSDYTISDTKVERGVYLGVFDHMMACNC